MNNTPFAMKMMVLFNHASCGLWCWLMVLPFFCAAQPTNVPTFPVEPTPSSFTHGEPEALLAALGFMAIGFGLFFLFFGYRAFWITLLITGFLVGAALTFILLRMRTSLALLWVIVVSVLCGIAGSLLVKLLWRVGVFISAFSLGFILGSLFLATPLGTELVKCCDFWPLLVLVILGGVLGVLAIVFEKHLIIIATSLGGAYGIAVGLDITFFHTDFADVIPSLLAQKTLVIDKHDPLPYVLITGIVIATILGSVIQWLITSGKYDPHAPKPKTNI